MATIITKEFVVRYGNDDEDCDWVDVTETDTLANVRTKIAAQFDDDMLPALEWGFLVNGMRVGIKGESVKSAWKLLEREATIQIVAKNKNVREAVAKTVSPETAPSSCQAKGNVKSQIFEDISAKSPRIEIKKRDRDVAGELQPEHANSNSQGSAACVPPTEPTFAKRARRKIKHEQEESESNKSPHNSDIARETSGDDTTDPTIKEETRLKFRKGREDNYRKYGDRYLLHRHDPKGINRLGGNLQCTFVFPCLENIKDLSNYPKPLGRDGREPTREDYGYCTYNTTWQPNGPMFAGQKTAALDLIPEYFEKTGKPFPIFMKRTRTGPNSECQGQLLGWEYVGNYRSIHDKELPFWESAANFTKASKKEIARKIYESSKNEKGYGRRILDEWRAKLKEAIQNEKEPRPSHCLAAKCLQKGFHSKMTDEKLAELIVKLDEYHNQHMVQFVEYDERIYDYCVKGKTSNNKDGKSINSSKNKAPAKAKDWYCFAEENLLFKY